MSYLDSTPGGRSGVAIIRSGGERPSSCDWGTVGSVDSALDWYASKLAGAVPTGIGIDTPLCWQTGNCGWRGADLWLRATYPEVQASVISTNSAYGAMVVQGPALALRLRDRLAPSPLHPNETHPKVLSPCPASTAIPEDYHHAARRRGLARCIDCDKYRRTHHDERRMGRSDIGLGDAPGADWRMEPGSDGACGTPYFPRRTRELTCFGRGAESGVFPSICAVGLGAGNDLLTHLAAQRESGADIELRMNQRVEGGSPGVGSHRLQGRSVGGEQVRYDRCRRA